MKRAQFTKAEALQLLADGHIPRAARLLGINKQAINTYTGVL